MFCMKSLFNPFTCINPNSSHYNIINSTPIAMLPEELIVHIFSFLSATNLATAQRVCRHWRKIAEEDTACGKDTLKNAWVVSPLRVSFLRKYLTLLNKAILFIARMKLNAYDLKKCLLSAMMRI
ncbi:hypothetical protein NEOC65_002384 [Neochlamydia sp. AcF65]|nr:hypothetical protein [Neochlamydia sp. AcF65]